MKQIAATEARTRFGQLLELAINEPVTIERKGRPVAVLLSSSEYQRLADLEDHYWGEKAVKALQSGFLSEGETNHWLKKSSI
ncbi:MAG: toxin-antitoxin system subunit antitoxin [Geobacteraceae bacterium GWC2_58_44]|nr:MAG: toxin-antitoxin system subunit antitoxin [Geobacteraceae bacterium GWC2_58_44]HBG07634.1 type II toxin-antitoxin system Phd/YefM family antitoxin [Geobacter sp.]